MSKDKKILTVIGGGAAGFFCAVNAARLNPALKVILIEKSSKLLAKVKISGGGRCNLTHACFEVPELIKHYPRGQQFLKKAFYQFNPTNTIEWFKERNVEVKQEADGRMFPVTNSSQTIMDCLLREANQYKVEILMNAEVKEIVKQENIFKLSLLNGKMMDADFVCIATGGYPKSSMFDWLKQTGHSFVAPLPSLFTFNMPGNAITTLMGVAINEVTVKIKGTKLLTNGPCLITHWGLSGPAILKLSAFGARDIAAMQYQFTAIINWLPNFNEKSLREEIQIIRQQSAAQLISNKNPFQLAQRFWQYQLNLAGIKEQTRWADLPAVAQNQLIKNLVTHELLVSGKTTFKEEFVTTGGITLNEIDANTMQSKLVPNLFFVGEIMDVDGVTGGFNFQHAWTSGWLAAKKIAQKSIGEEIMY